jgi:hypothetical protein
MVAVPSKHRHERRAPGAASSQLCKDGESTGQVDDRRQNASQQPVWFKSVDNIEHADRNKSDDKDVEKFHTPPPAGNALSGAVYGERHGQNNGTAPTSMARFRVLMAPSYR